MFSLRRIIYALLFVACSFPAMAQDPYYTSFNKLSGLPSNTIYDIFQDSKGYIWIANNEGLTRYDGFEFKTYLRKGQTSKSGNQVTEDKYGRIWYKNFDGCLYYILNDSLQALKQNSPVGNLSYGIMGDKLLVLQKLGFDFFDLKTLQLIKTIPFDLTYFVTELSFKDKYYISYDTTLVTITPDMNIKREPASITGFVAPSRDGVVILSQKNEVTSCDEFVGGTERKKLDVANILYTHGFAYCGGFYWVFTPNGAWVYNEAGENVNNGVPLFGSKSISSILRDRDGNYWLGTLNEGILFVPDLNTKLFTTPGFVPNLLNTVRQKVYIGTKENSVYTFDINSSKLEMKFAESLRHEIICFLADTVNGIFNFSSTKLYQTDTFFRHVKGEQKNSIKDLAIVDRKYYAYASTGTIGLVKVRDDIASPYDSVYKANKIAHIPNTAWLVDRCRGRAVAYNAASGCIYGGTSKGLFAIQPRQTTELKYNGETIYTKKLVYFRNKVYVLTPQNQVFEIDAKHNIRSIGLQGENELYLNIKAAGGELYLLTKNGFRVLDTVSGAVKILGLHPGIRVEEINDLDIVNNRFVFSSERGLIVISESVKSDSVVPPNLEINSITVNGKEVRKDGEMQFLHTENDVEINYSILSFSTDRRYQLLYQINGGAWHSTSGETRNLKLAALSPGSYKISFRLAAIDADKWYAAKPVEFTISKPFWAEWWFMGGCVLLLVAVVYAYYQWQTTLLKKQNQLVVEKVELERNLRNSMLTSIRSQMNPHFFYNALNAIQSFIFSDDKRNAATYLVKLSKLTRMILEMSEKESVTLDEETESLKLYLELEKMRFSDDFNYELQIANNVDGDLVKIPPMIVQPYVENAIKHGLLHKKGNKYLTILFERVDEDIVITIDDNGIGREKSNELNQIKKERHSPFSTEANSKRIELLNKGRGRNIGVLFVDKKDEQGVPTGTTVVISIPLILRK